MDSKKMRNILLVSLCGFCVSGMQLGSSQSGPAVPSASEGLVGGASDPIVAAATSYSGNQRSAQNYIQSSYGNMQGNYGNMQNNYGGMQNLYGANEYSGGYDNSKIDYGFSCYGRPAALYGDGNYDCRIFHVCQADGRQDTLKCPKQTRFNNYLGVCDWENKIDQSCMPLYKEEYSQGYEQGQSGYSGQQSGYGQQNSYGGQQSGYGGQQQSGYGTQQANYGKQQYRRR